MKSRYVRNIICTVIAALLSFGSPGQVFAEETTENLEEVILEMESEELIENQTDNIEQAQEDVTQDIQENISEAQEETQSNTTEEAQEETQSNTTEEAQEETTVDITEETQVDTSNQEDIEITELPSQVKCYEGDMAQITLHADGESLSYRWYYSKDGGNTWKTCQYGNTYKTSSLTFNVQLYQFNYMFKCLVKDKYGNEKWSNAVTLLAGDIGIINQPTDNECSIGEVTEFNVNAVGNKLTYCWYYSKDAGTTWNICSYDGSRTNTLAFQTQKYQYGYIFKCLITDRYGNSVMSDEAKLISKSIQITQQPVNEKLFIGDMTSFHVETDGENISYRWYYSKDNGNTWKTCQYDGYKTDTLAFCVNKYQYGYLFRCQIKAADGAVLVSDAAALEAGAMEIIKEPESAECEIGELTNFTVKAKGNVASYRWYYSKDSGDTWKTCQYDGYKTDTLAFEMQKYQDGYMFRCVVTDIEGNTITTNAVKLEKKDNKKRVFILNDEEHDSIYKNPYEILVDYEEFKSNVQLDNSKVAMSIDINAKINKNDVLLLHFTAFSENASGKINITAGTTGYNGNFAVQVENTEYIIPISGYNFIENINIALSTQAQNIYIGNFELINCGAVDVTALKTGIFDKSNQNIEDVINFTDGIGYAATDIVTDNEYLYTVHRGTLTIYSIENKEKPEIISSITGLGNSREIAFGKDNKILAISARENGVYFVDISNPYSPYIISSVEAMGLATGIFVEGNHCFISSRYHGIEIYDISDIKNPKFCAQIYESNSELYDCYVDDNYLYASSWAQKKIYVYSLNDIYSPQKVSTISVNGNAAGCYARAGVLYVATGYHSNDDKSTITSAGYGMGNGMDIYDVSNPSNPKWLSTASIDGRYFYSGFDHWRVNISGNYAYLTSANNGMYVWDISEPTAPKRVDKVTISIPNSSASYKKIDLNQKYLFSFNQEEASQSFVTACAVVDGYVYICTNSGDIFSNKSNQTLSGKHKGMYAISLEEAVYEENEKGILTGKKVSAENKNLQIADYNAVQYITGDTIYAITESDLYYYFAAGSNGIKVYTKNMELVGNYQTKGFAKDLKITDNIMYVAESDCGLGVYELDGKQIREIGRCNYDSYNTAFSYLSMFPNQKYLLAQIGWSRYAIIDVTNPRSPKIEKETTTGTMYYHNLCNGLVSEKYTCVYDRSYITWFSLNNDNQVTQVCKLNNTVYEETSGVAAAGDYALTVYNNGYIYYKPDTVSQESLKSAKYVKIPNVKKLKGEPTVYGDILIVSYGVNRQITMIDISDIDNPKLIAQVSVDGNPGIVYVNEKNIFVPLGHGGILKIDL